MNSNPIDPEELRLIEVVAEAALVLCGPSRGNKLALLDDLENAADHLAVYRDRRAKASAPVAPERCEPPEGQHCDSTWHWLHIPSLIGLAGTFEPWCWSDAGNWFQSLDDQSTAEYMHKVGWRYHSPCAPDIRQPVTDEDVSKFFASHGWHLSWCNPDQIRTILAHFSAPIVSPGVEPTDDELVERIAEAIYVARGNPPWAPWGPKASRDLELHARKLARIAVSVGRFRSPPQTEITDEEIIALHAQVYADRSYPSRDGALTFARTLLSKHGVGR